MACFMYIVIASKGRRPERAFTEFRDNTASCARLSLTSSCSPIIEIIEHIWYSADAQRFNEQFSFCLVCLSLNLTELRPFN